MDMKLNILILKRLRLEKIMKFQKSEYTGNSHQVTSGIKKDKIMNYF